MRKHRLFLLAVPGMAVLGTAAYHPVAPAADAGAVTAAAARHLADAQLVRTTTADPGDNPGEIRAALVSLHEPPPPTTTTTTTLPPPPPTTTTTTTLPPPPSTTALPPPTTTLPPAPGGTYVPAGGVWAELRQCESGGNYAENTGNGYYGAYQFALPTWRSLGLSGLPSDAPPEVQDQAAKELQARSGWGQWPACSAKLGL